MALVGGPALFESFFLGGEEALCFAVEVMIEGLGDGVHVFFFYLDFCLIVILEVRSLLKLRGCEELVRLKQEVPCRGHPL